MAPPDFGRTVNPTYLNQEGYITLLLAPLDFQTFLGPCKKQKIAYLGDGQDYLFNKDFIPFISYWYCLQLKVSKFQNEFMKLSFLPKYEPKIVRISAWAQYRAEIFTMFGSYFGRNDNFINSFWNLLTFSCRQYQ